MAISRPMRDMPETIIFSTDEEVCMAVLICCVRASSGESSIGGVGGVEGDGSSIPFTVSQF